MEFNKRGEVNSFASKLMNAVGTRERPAEKQHHQQTVISGATNKMGTASTIASDMTITGNIVCEEGAVQVLGTINGELRVADLVIGEGCKVDGDVYALTLTVEGNVTGTIHANHVILMQSAEVKGDIYHYSLKIERDALFEGLSRRMQTEMGSVKMQPMKPSETPAPSRYEPTAAAAPSGPVLASAEDKPSSSDRPLIFPAQASTT